MTWRIYIIDKILPDYKIWFEFYPPATPRDIKRMGKEFNIELQSDLIALLQESNGIGEHMQFKDGTDMLIGYLIWPVDKIIEENRSIREFSNQEGYFMPFDHLFFFADAGDGDLFGYSITSKNLCFHSIYRWDHEDDSRTWYADGIEGFLQTWLKK